MKFSTKETKATANGIACLAIVKTLLEIMQKKDLLSEEEIDIILSCAIVETNEADEFDEMIEAKGLIENLLTNHDQLVPTGPREFC
ncbi:MAG: hypothetical protein GKR93_14685 [Gammaproteobacteria bacterium]|nr:hypothetical protein [Gammaproteobacteria bacterium]